MNRLNRILLGVLFVFLPFVGISQTVKEITPQMLWQSREFSPQYVSGLNSMNDGEHYTVIENRNTEIVKYKYENGEKVQTLLSINDLGVDNIPYIEEYTFSSNEQLVMIQCNSNYIYRRSFTADFYVYDFAAKKLIPVSDKGAQQLATFSPDGSMVAFVRENNIFIKNLKTNTETQVTLDGKRNEIINGAPDWVYEEEFEFARAFEWSADSKKLAYYKFDETKVKQFNMTMFKGEQPEIEENMLYPENYEFKYPKAGEENSKVSIWAYNIDTKFTRALTSGTEEYVPRIKWTQDANLLCIFSLNRHQNKLNYLLADATTGKAKVVFTDTDSAYIDEKYFDYTTFLADKLHFIVASERDGYNHLYLCDLNGKVVNQITKGAWDVTDYLGYDEASKTVYYEASVSKPYNREVFAINVNGKKNKQISTGEGTASINFSEGYKFYVQTFSNHNTPPVITVHNSKGLVLRTLKDNAALKEKVAQFGGTNKEFFTFKTTEGVELYGYMIKPHDFDANKKYPVFMTQYSGPNSQSVSNRWEFGWSQLLAQKGYIVACVDPRGTGNRGRDFRKVTYLQLGKYETIDQIEAAKYLGTLPFIDKSRIGIYGWSYGGFMASLCITKGADYFKTAIAVAPVTNWRYYDNIYTERFMRTPQENPEGYDSNSPVNHADKLKGKFLLIHGTADDNVHVQNSMEFAEALVQANKDFRMQYYTNRNHGIYGGNTRFHLQMLMTNFILENL